MYVMRLTTTVSGCSFLSLSEAVRSRHFNGKHVSILVAHNVLVLGRLYTFSTEAWFSTFPTTRSLCSSMLMFCTQLHVTQLYHTAQNALFKYKQNTHSDHLSPHRQVKTHSFGQPISYTNGNPVFFTQDKKRDTT